jgi:polyphenol oxidase
MITLSPLNDLKSVRHGFFTRRGGVSSGLYGSMNCGFGSSDQHEAVTENRARIAASFDLSPNRLVTMFQVHGNEVVTVTEPWPPANAPRVDGMVTDRPEIVLGVLAADCAPVLFADGTAGVIGACHAGWKGAIAGVTDSVIAAMEKLGAKRERIVAGIGPCIAFRSYEVGPEFRLPFIEQDAANDDFFAAGRKGDRLRFDLAGYIGRKLGQAGLEVVQACPHDTLIEERRFFSYRRSCLRGEPDYGRNISAIVLQG